MRLPTVPPRDPDAASAPGVFVTNDDLARLEHKARGYSFLPRQPVHSLLSGRRGSRVRGRGLDFDEIRRYLPGDDPRTIDWKITQRTGTAHVRVFTEERDRPAMVVVDQRASMFFGTRVAMKSVVAAQLAALAAWRVFGQGDRVGGVVFSDTEIREVRPHRSRRRVMQLLGDVATLNQQLSVDSRPDDPERLNEALRRVVRSVRHSSLVVVISDFHGADGDTERLLTRLSEHNDVVCALLYDPIKTSIPEAGRIAVSRGSTQLELDTGRGRQMRDLGEYFAADLKRTRSSLARVGVPVLLVDTEEDPADQIRRQLGTVGGMRR
jgi:uncharacterized protein (DUF58 family)